MRYLPIIATEMILASAVAIVLYVWDKRQAKKNASGAKRPEPGEPRTQTPHHRISENTLLFWSLIGGWPGAWWASQRFRHKTQKNSFRIRFWATALIHIAIVSGVLWFGGAR